MAAAWKTSPELIQVPKFSLMVIFVVVVMLFGRSVMQINKYLEIAVWLIAPGAFRGIKQ